MFGSFNPIGAVQTASGYDVAWQNISTGQYTVWTTDSNGDYTGNSSAQSRETVTRWNHSRLLSIKT